MDPLLQILVNLLCEMIADSAQSVCIHSVQKRTKVVVFAGALQRSRFAVRYALRVLPLVCRSFRDETRKIPLIPFLLAYESHIPIFVNEAETRVDVHTTGRNHFFDGIGTAVHAWLLEHNPQEYDPSPYGQLDSQLSAFKTRDLFEYASICLLRRREYGLLTLSGPLRHVRRHVRRHDGVGQECDTPLKITTRLAGSQDIVALKHVPIKVVEFLHAMRDDVYTMRQRGHAMTPCEHGSCKLLTIAFHENSKAGVTDDTADQVNEPTRSHWKEYRMTYGSTVHYIDTDLKVDLPNRIKQDSGLTTTNEHSELDSSDSEEERDRHGLFRSDVFPLRCSVYWIDLCMTFSVGFVFRKMVMRAFGVCETSSCCSRTCADAFQKDFDRQCILRISDLDRLEIDSKVPGRGNRMPTARCLFERAIELNQTVWRRMQRRKSTATYPHGNEVDPYVIQMLNLNALLLFAATLECETIVRDNKKQTSFIPGSYPLCTEKYQSFAAFVQSERLWRKPLKQLKTVLLPYSATVTSSLITERVPRNYSAHAALFDRIKSATIF